MERVQLKAYNFKAGVSKPDKTETRVRVFNTDFWFETHGAGCRKSRDKIDENKYQLVKEIG